MIRARALILDLDGVIIDSEPIHRQAEETAFQHFGIAVPESFYDEFRGRSDDDMASHVVANSPEARVTAADFLSVKNDAYRRLRLQMVPIPGALDFVRAARQRFEKLAVTTSATRADQEFAFDRFGLRLYFDAVVTAEDLARTKPHPDPYVQTTARLGIEPAQCLVVEDSKNGITSAKHAGCLVVGITTSLSRDELIDPGPDYGPDYIVESFSELASFLGARACLPSRCW